MDMYLKPVCSIDEDEVMMSFSNDLISFNIDGIDIMEYAMAGNACKNGSSYNGDVIKVNNGMVSITIASYGGHIGGSITCNLKAEYCGDAFIRAYDALAVIELE